MKDFSSWGTQDLFIDIASDDKRFYKLLKIIHEFYLEDISFWCEADVDGIFIMDDWGSNSSLLIDPEAWRSIFKPLYREYCQIIHSSGKHVFMHSDGNIESIFGAW